MPNDHEEWKLKSGEKVTRDQYSGDIFYTLTKKDGTTVTVYMGDKMEVTLDKVSVDGKTVYAATDQYGSSGAYIQYDDSKNGKSGVQLDKSTNQEFKKTVRQLSDQDLHLDESWAEIEKFVDASRKEIEKSKNLVATKITGGHDVKEIPTSSNLIAAVAKSRDGVIV